MAGWIKMPLGTEAGLCPGDLVLDGSPAPPKRKQSPLGPPQFSAKVNCGQTAGWIKTALSTDVGLGPGHIVLDGEPALLPKQDGGAPSQIFGSFLL